MIKERKYSKCGFCCSQCPAFKDNSQTEEARKRGSAVWEKYYGLHFNPEIVKCEGCQSAEPWKTGNLLPDRRCVIRACAVYNGVLTCSHCSLFPCEEYSKRVPGADLRRQREEASHIKINNSEYLEYIEPFEGQTHLKELHSALKPEEIVGPKQFSASGDVVPFPEKIGSDSENLRVMRQLHLLLGKVFSAKATNYSGQILLDRKKPYIYGILWVMGLYGEFKGDQLVLENAKHQSKKKCNRLVRKTDNALHDAVRDAVNTLDMYDIHFDFKPSKKEWTLALEAREVAGGLVVLKALKSYVSQLAITYGEPDYAAGYAMKGEAFKLFTRLDMRPQQ
jgi:hypothetical protein